MKSVNDRTKNLAAEIKDERLRRITFKKRRIGLVKKASQLSILTGSLVQLKIFNEKDNSFVEFYTTGEDDLEGISKDSVKVQEYVKFFSKHDELLSKIDKHVTQHGNTVGNTNYPNALNEDFHKNLCQELDHKNLFALFSFSKQKSYILDRLDRSDHALDK